MFSTVEIPLWLLILILLFAAVTALSHFLLPSVRWFFRRRMERVVTRLNKRLERPIQPFKLARRHDMIQRLIYDAQVIEAAGAWAKAKGVPENVGFETARRYAREIVPRFSATAYFGFAIRLARLIAQSFYKVRTSSADEDALSGIDPDATVIFVMNHRSNMDYVLVTYLAAERSALSYAVGEWARIWPLTSLIKAMGAYFIRRKNSNDLYRTVLERYVQLATKGGVTQAVFPEGKLSLTGHTAPAKLGILNYIIKDFDPQASGDVVFVPVSLNYDRVLEDRFLLEATQSGRHAFRFRLVGILGFIFRQIKLMFQRRFHRFGDAAVHFGRPMSLRNFPLNTKDSATKQVGRELMKRISTGIPALSVPTICYVMACSSGSMGREEIKLALIDLVPLLRTKGVPFHAPDNDLDEAMRIGLRILTLRRMFKEKDGQYSIEPEERELVQYYANSIAESVGNLSEIKSRVENAATARS
ncbi:MAG: 1-acyl-sn-glycerol-3-phosphate acyltransferase [Pseudoruegeria sp.]